MRSVSTPSGLPGPSTPHSLLGPSPAARGSRRRPSRLGAWLLPAAFAASILFLAACGGDSGSKTDGAGSSGETTADAPTGRFGEVESVAWFEGSFDEALAEAKAQNKLLLVDVWSDHCAQCGIMDEEVWASPEGVALVGDAVAVKVPSDAPESYGFRHIYPITGLPAILLLNSDGSEINRVVGYQSRDQFLVEATEMMTGVDPVPALESRVQANPEDTGTRFTLLEHYLFRADETKAREQMDAITTADPNNLQGNADRAIRALAKYYAFFLMDAGGSAEIWKTLPEKYPTSSALTAALKATLDHAKTSGTVSDWTTWVCGLSDKNSADGRFNSAVAMYAFRNGVRGSCLAEAARRAKDLGTAPANVDSVITVLSGS